MVQQEKLAVTNRCVAIISFVNATSFGSYKEFTEDENQQSNNFWGLIDGDTCM